MIFVPPASKSTFHNDAKFSNVPHLQDGVNMIFGQYHYPVFAQSETNDPIKSPLGQLNATCGYQSGISDLKMM